MLWALYGATASKTAPTTWTDTIERRHTMLTGYVVEVPVGAPLDEVLRIAKRWEHPAPDTLVAILRKRFASPLTARWVDSTGAPRRIRLSRQAVDRLEAGGFFRMLADALASYGELDRDKLKALGSRQPLALSKLLAHEKAAYEKRLGEAERSADEVVDGTYFRGEAQRIRRHLDGLEAEIGLLSERRAAGRRGPAPSGPSRAQLNRDVETIRGVVDGRLRPNPTARTKRDLVRDSLAALGTTRRAATIQRVCDSLRPWPRTGSNFAEALLAELLGRSRKWVHETRKS